MSMADDPIARVKEYARHHRLVLAAELGHGVHGSVFTAQSQPEKGIAMLPTAVKAHKREADYLRERDVYLRLRENSVASIQGCHVPEMLCYDDHLWIIEMTVVVPPFVLDFGGAFLDKAPDFSDEVMADWRAEKIEQYRRSLA